MLFFPIGDDQSDASDYSVATSACSSLIPHPDRKDYQGEVLQMNDSHLRQMHQHMDMRGMPSSHNASTDVTNTSTSSGKLTRLNVYTCIRILLAFDKFDRFLIDSTK